MLRPTLFFALSLLLLVGVRSACAQGREEFNGPFNDWANVKARFGARGNGKADDTKALQQAIDSMGMAFRAFNPGPHPYVVIYLPAGTYCISSTLQLKGKLGISIVGEDPLRTVIKWIGADQDTMLWANGSAYFRISRLAWDAGGRKDMEAIGIHWKDKWQSTMGQSYAALNIEISDNRFFGGFRHGISGGSTPKTGTGANDSEITIRRCVFSNCTLSGIEIAGYNALDYWIWDCRFLQCANGVRCAYGNYHVYHSFFSGSTVSDVHNNNGYYNSVRGCYSINANDFSSDEGASSNPFKRIFQDNVIIRPHHIPIRHNHLGRITLMGNTITVSVDTIYKFSIYNKSWFRGIYEALSLHNRYGYSDPIKLDVPNKRLYSYGDEMLPAVKPDTASFLSSMDHTPPFVKRVVLEVPDKADAASIQAILDRAASMNGRKPIVHFGAGVWKINRTLQIPAGTDMQLIGDGWMNGSVIQQQDTSFKGPMIRVGGPSFITIKDITIGNAGAKKGTDAGILFFNVDQKGAEVHLDQIYSPSADTSLVVKDLDHLYVQKDNSFFMYGNYISGGPLVQRGQGEARVACYGGQYARLSVQQNASFIAKDCWWEGREKMALDLSGWGRVTIDGSKLAPYKNDSTPGVYIGKFRGNINLMNMYLQAGLDVLRDNPALNLLVWNVHFYYKMDMAGFEQGGVNYKLALLGITGQCFDSQNPLCKAITCPQDIQQNIGNINSFLDTQTAQTRLAHPILLRNLPAEISNIYISRVSLGVMNKGLVFNQSR